MMPQDEKAAKEVEAKAPEIVIPAAPAKAARKARKAPKAAKPASETAKRGPGRPKGSGKKAVDAPKGSGKKRGPGRPKGSGKKAVDAPKAAGRRGRPKSAEKAVREAYASGIRRFGSISKAVFQATGQKIQFPAFAKALKGLREKAAP